MHFGQSQMMCQICPSKRSISSAISNAERILQNLNRITHAHFTNKKNQKNAFNSKLFDSHYSCQFTGGSCSTFMNKKRELNRIEEQLNSQLSIVVNSFHDIEDTEQSKIKYQLFQLFRGYYPKAAQAIERISTK